MNDKSEEPMIFYTETSRLALNLMCFMIGLTCLTFTVEFFFNLFTMPWNGVLDRVIGIVFTIIGGWLSYRFLKPTFLLIKHWFIDPIINLFRFANKIVRKIIY